MTVDELIEKLQETGHHTAPVHIADGAYPYSDETYPIERIWFDEVDDGNPYTVVVLDNA